jgi:hypothetical protein
MNPPRTHPTATESLKNNERGFPAEIRSACTLSFTNTIICVSVETFSASSTERKQPAVPSRRNSSWARLKLSILV